MFNSPPLSILQADRVRIVANNNLRRETQCKNVSLRRLVGHIIVVALLDDMQNERTRRPPPSYSETVSKPAVACQQAAYVYGSFSTLKLYDTPRLEEHMETNDDAASDNGSDEDFALARMKFHPRMCIREGRHPDWTPEGSNTLDSFQGRESMWAATRSTARNETLVIETVEEITDFED